MNDKIVLIVGPSGCGKSTVVDCMEKLYNLKSVVSYTTREPRYEGEKGHIFLSEEIFKSMPDMCAYTFFNGNHYGVTADVVNRSDLYIIDPAGVEYFKEHYSGTKEPVVVYIDTPEEVCRERMLARGDSEKAVEERIEHDKVAFASGKAMADVVVLNDGSQKPSVVACEILNKSGLVVPVSEKDKIQRNLTQTEIRIQGVLKNMEKSQNTLERHKKTLEKKRNACLKFGFDPKTVDVSEFRDSRSMEQYWAYSDFTDVEDRISDTMKKLSEYRDKLSEYRAKDFAEKQKNDVPIVPAVEEFLANWKSDAEVYLRDQVVGMKTLIDEIRETRQEIRKKYLPYDFEHKREIAEEEKAAQVDAYSAKQRVLVKYSADVRALYEHRGLDFEARLNKVLSDEVIRKRVDLFRRCSAEVGVITDATGLRIGQDLNLNGVVVGENGKASVRTIGAGGYNIQCFHYRVLVTPVREKESLDSVISNSSKIAAMQSKNDKMPENEMAL